MECMFPGSSTAARRFGVDTVELTPGSIRKVSGVTVSAWEGDHPSGAPALLLRLDLAGRTLAYTGDTAWTENLAAAAAVCLYASARAHAQQDHAVSRSAPPR